MVSNQIAEKLNSLQEVLKAEQKPVYIALSGGIDSLTLMTIAAKVRTAPTIAMHAVSAAVPIEATQRCRELAGKYHWTLKELNAGEFNSEQYIQNPVNRCYYCKSSLFESIVAEVGLGCLIATGTNTDDLGDYRPGLKAARERDVWQPYVEAGISKNMIRELALESGLGALAQLPAQPCLSSRIETGISINVIDLRFVHQVETELSRYLGADDIRCRIVNDGVVAQLPADSQAFGDHKVYDTVVELVGNLCTDNNRKFLRVEPYRMGSAFLRNAEVGL